MDEQYGPDGADPDDARGSDPGSPRSWRPSWRAAVLGLLLGAGLWAAWLGWDHEASYDRIAHQEQYPYTTLQVLGCALSVGLATAVVAARGRPLEAALGVGAGFWVAWSARAATADESGLWLVGALLLAVGLAVGTGVAAALGLGAGAVLRRARRRGPGPAHP